MPPVTVAKWRPVAVAIATGAGCVLWCLTLKTVDAGGHAIPWYLTLFGLSGLCLRLLRARNWQPNDAVHHTGFRNREPLNILEALSISFLVAAVVVYSFACLSIFLPKKPLVSRRQVVDIELTSLTDKVDNEELLPGETEAEPVRKHVGDLVTMQGTLQPQPAAASSTAREESQKKAEPSKVFKKPQEQPKTPAPPTVSSSPLVPPIVTPLGVQPPVKPQPMSMPANWSTQVVKNFTPRRTSAPKDKNGPMFEEMQPPELVEMVDNEGSTESTKNTQVGGRSSGGTGAKSELNTYLKELHKKIKTAWAPPRGQSRKAEILFRIKKPGRLVSIKVVRSSGDNDTDEAAMHAVTAAVKAQPDLPAAYDAPWLDVMYNFNYTADGLQELTPKTDSD